MLFKFVLSAMSMSSIGYLITQIQMNINIMVQGFNQGHGHRDAKSVENILNDQF